MTRPEPREVIYDAIDHERTWQDHRYGNGQHTRAGWVTLLAKWLGKAADAADRGNHEEFGRRLTQVAAIAVQAREKGWLESEEPEEVEPGIEGSAAELAELAAAVQDDPERQAVLEEWGVDVDALFAVTKPALTVLDGGRA